MSSPGSPAAPTTFTLHRRQHGHDVDDWLQAERELQIDPNVDDRLQINASGVARSGSPSREVR